jgi:predicted secreted protein
MSGGTITEIISRLKDERGKKVIFLSHCLLNENTRYFGGACRIAGVDEITGALQKKGIGIVQMKCPEQKTWGGVLKRYMLMGYCIKGTILRPFLKTFMIFFLWKTRWSFKKIAKEVVSEIRDYMDSGYEVCGIIGIKGSPSCGVSAALDLKKAAVFAADLNIETLSRQYFNENCYKNCLADKSGIFFEALHRELLAKNMNVKFFEHDLLAEIEGKTSNVNFEEIL